MKALNIFPKTSYLGFVPFIVMKLLFLHRVIYRIYLVIKIKKNFGQFRCFLGILLIISVSIHEIMVLFFYDDASKAQMNRRVQHGICEKEFHFLRTVAWHCLRLK